MTFPFCILEDDLTSQLQHSTNCLNTTFFVTTVIDCNIDNLPLVLLFA
uniref:Uncharacterized protein n=1 Tax=Anguilla anguilla TaxID=7936 RepID=A0A0E9S4W7_ANGAN